MPLDGPMRASKSMGDAVDMVATMQEKEEGRVGDVSSLSEDGID